MNKSLNYVNRIVWFTRENLSHLILVKNDSREVFDSQLLDFVGVGVHFDEDDVALV